MAMRLSGLVSGLDTDSIVKELVSAHALKKEKIVKAQTKLSWKQEIWKDLNSKIYNLYSSTLSDLRFSFAYNKKSTVISDSTKAAVTAGSNTPNGTQTLEIKKLAKAGYLTGEKLTMADGSKVTGSTTLSEVGLNLPSKINITVGGTLKTIDLKTDTTVNGLVNSLKSAGVNASFDTVNQRFFISSKASGLESDFTLSADSPDGNLALESLGLTASSGAIKIDGADAEIKLNGATFTSSSNTLVVNGLTIEAKEVTSNAISITTATDNKGIYDTIKNFIKEYNTLVNEMDTLYGANLAKGFEPLTEEEKESMSEGEIEKWEQKIKDSLLRRDGTINSVSSAMKGAMSKTFEVNGKKMSLSSFGINTLEYFIAKEGEKSAYHIDGDGDDSSTSGKDDKLMAAIASNPEDVIGFFTQLATEVYGEIDNKMKKTELSSVFTVYNDKQLENDYKEYDKEIKKMEDKLKSLEDYYYKKFAAMEKALSQLQSNSSALASLLGNNSSN